MDKQSEKKGIHQKLLAKKVDNYLLVVLTIVFVFLMINGTITAFADGRRVSGQMAELQTSIDAMEARIDGETDGIVKNLDPDYRRAVYEKSRGILAPGEELLPIYGEEKESP